MSIALSAGALLGPAFEELAASLRTVTVRVHARSRRGEGLGSGVLWSRHGLVITNAHVAQSSRAMLELSDGRTFESNLVARDPRRDLAAYALAHDDLPRATIADARGLRVGELVVALGHPHGVRSALSTGIVHAPPHGDPYIRSDVKLAPGNSGGPLATVSGDIVGINAMIVGGLGIAIASHVVDDFVRQAVFDSFGTPHRSRGERRPRVA
jgi:serine protease Do